MKPTKTVPFLCEKDWGGEGLKRFGKSLTSPKTGESWELSAHPNGQSMVYGQTLSQAVSAFGRNLTGEGFTGDFPLLIKLLDAQENLSVQVHPDDAMAREFGDPYGKTEAWVVLDAPPVAELILGVDCSPAQMEAAIQNGTMEEHLIRIPVQRGDCLFIPAGTVHALTQGIMVYEVQQSSDCTFRLYAWGRDAQLHIPQSLQAMAIPHPDAGKVTPTQIPMEEGICERLVSCSAFMLDRLTLQKPLTQATDGSRFYAYTAFSQGEMRHSEGTIPYGKGDTILVPADAGEYTLTGGQLLKAYLP